MHQIIEACKSGNSFAQKRLFDHFVKRLFRLALRYMRSAEDAEEMVMNGFLKFFRSINEFEYHDENRLEAWLKRIVVNEINFKSMRNKHFCLKNKHPILIIKYSIRNFQITILLFDFIIIYFFYYMIRYGIMKKIVYIYQLN